MTKVAILCGDDVKKWNRHSITVDGETLQERTVRLLRSNGVEDITITEKVEGQHPKIEGVKYVVNKLTGNDMGCVVGVPGHDLYIFGDVFFSEEAIKTILEVKTNFYGRTKKGIVKHYGEMFAIRVDEKLSEVLKKMWHEYQTGEIKRLWSWDLYSRIQGKDFYVHRNTGNFTEINDITEDFDSPKDLERWLHKYEKRTTNN